MRTFIFYPSYLPHFPPDEKRLYPTIIREKAANARTNQPLTGIKKVVRIPTPIQNITKPSSCFIRAPGIGFLILFYVLFFERCILADTPCRFLLSASHPDTVFKIRYRLLCLCFRLVLLEHIHCVLDGVCHRALVLFTACRKLVYEIRHHVENLRYRILILHIDQLRDTV